MPAEGQTAIGPNGERAVYHGGQWVIAPTVSAPSGIPGAFVPPNPQRVAEKQAEAARQAAADRRAEEANARAASAEARAQQKFEREDTVTPTPGDMSLTGDAYLATIDPGLAAQVKALSEGRRAFPTGTALKDPAIRELIAAATQYDPSLDAANAATRVATRKDFTSGKARQNITAINTALGHLGTLSQSAEALKNRGWRTWNTIGNALLTETGDKRVKEFGIARDAVANELMRVFRGTGGSLQEIEEWKAAIDSSDSPDQLRAEIGKAVELLNSRLMAMGDQYQQGLGQSKDPVSLLNPHAQEVFNALSPGGPGVYTGGGGGGAPPPLGGGSPLNSGGSAPGQTAATGPVKNVFDAETAAGLNSLVRRGRPYEEAAAFAQSKGYPVPAPGQYAAAVAWQKAHPDTPYNASDPTHPEATTLRERAAASPLGGYMGGAADALTAGTVDELAGAASALSGGDYIQARDAANANKNVIAEQNPTANLLGNVTGGVLGSMGGGAALARLAPGAVAATTGALGRFAPAAGDAAYGAAYGAGENNQDRMMGAVENALLAPVVGKAARSTTKGLANIISPPSGAFGPIYAQGVFPTIGQRLGKSGLAGRIINTGEQAMQSVPVLGSMVARARQLPRDAYQVGAFDEALQEIGQQLPPGTGPGTDAHAFASQAFGKAYDRARSGMQFLPDPTYTSEAQAFAQVLDNGTLDEAQVGQVLQRINTAVNSRLSATGGALPGDAYKAAASDLAETQRQWAKSDPLKAGALGDYLTIFDNAARRNSDPQAVAMLDQADRGYAKLVRVQNASARGGVGKDDGTFTPNQLGAAVKQESGGVRSGPYLRGDALMQDYANAGRGLSDTLPNSGTADRLYGGQLAAGVGGTALGVPGALIAHPGSLAPFALYAPGINKAVTRAIAPRDVTLPPNLAAPLVALASQVEKRAPIAGRLAVPAALQWWEAQP